MEQTITKEILRVELFAGDRPAVELLYNRYSGMLFSYILQFVPDREEAGSLLADVFSRLIPQLREAFDSSLSLFCWLQVETRKIVLTYLKEKDSGGDGHAGAADQRGELGKGHVRAADEHREPGIGHAGAADEHREPGALLTGGRDQRNYFSLLAEASPEHQWIFREMFIYGRGKEELALASGKDLAYVSRLLRECLSIVRKNLG